MSRRVHTTLVVSALTAGLVASLGAQAPPSPQGPGRSDPSFPLPSIAPGVDYTVPTEAEITQALGRIRDYFVRSTPYRVVDTATGQALTNLTTPTRTAGIDLGPGEFNDWTYSMGVVLAGMLHATDVTGDRSFEEYTRKNFDFIVNHLEFFRRQAKEFGPQPYGYRRLLEMRELDDCGAIGAALVKTFKRTKDARFRPLIDIVDEFVSHKMTRMPDRTLARTRPHPVSMWVDDMYMSIPFLAQMGDLTGDRKYFDDAAHQVVQYASRLMNPTTGLFDHSWFAHEPTDPKFYWGRGAGWAMMAIAELLSVMPEQHPRRARCSPSSGAVPRVQPASRAAPASGIRSSIAKTATSSRRPPRCSRSRLRVASTADGCSQSTRRSRRPDGARSRNGSVQTAPSRARSSPRRRRTTRSTTTTGLPIPGVSGFWRRTHGRGGSPVHDPQFRHRQDPQHVSLPAEEVAGSW